MRIVFILLLFFSNTYCSKKYTFMLSPAGDAQNPGRLLADTTERSVARQLAEELKKRLEDETSARVIMTHDAGEAITQEQKANFANCLADFYCALSVTPSEQLSISVFYYKIGTLAPLPTNKLALYTANQAYIFNATHTEQLAKKFIAPQYHNKFVCNRPLGGPIKSLHGIIAPAVDIEITINQMTDSALYLEPLVQALKDIIPHEHNN